MDKILLVITHLPDQQSALRIAQALLESRAAACVNILGACTSMYRWQGKIQTSGEVPLLIKTTRAGYSRVEGLIRASHPYELPEIIGVSVERGLEDYLKWIGQETQLAAEPEPDSPGQD